MVNLQICYALFIQVGILMSQYLTTSIRCCNELESLKMNNKARAIHKRVDTTLLTKILSLKDVVTK